MKPDSRLQIRSSSERGHRERFRSQQREFEKSVGEDTWQRMIGPLVDFALRRMAGSEEGELAFPADADDRLREDFASVQGAIARWRPLHSMEVAGTVLIRRFARSMATRVPAEPASWIRASVLFSTSKEWASFFDAIPADAITGCLEELTHSPANVADCIYGLDLTSEHFINIGAQAIEVDWAKTSQLIQFASHCILHLACKVRFELLSGLPVGHLIRWLLNLPHPVVQVVALNYVRDPDFLEALVEVATMLPPSPSRDLLLLLLMRRNLQLWTEIERKILDAPRRLAPLRDEDREILKWMKANWISDEMPRRSLSLVSRLERGRDSIAVAGIVLRHLVPFQGAFSEEVKCLKSFRRDLLGLFRRCGPDGVVENCVANPTTTGLAAGALLVLDNPSQQRFEQILSGYRQWLRATRQPWYRTFGPLEDEMVRSLATALAQIEDAPTVSEGLIASVRQPSQGWKFEYQRWSRSLPAVTHVIVVVALAASCIVENEGRCERSARLMELAWTEFQALVEGAPTDFRPEQIASPVAYVWVCARKALESGESRLEEAVESLDLPELVLLAANNLRNNGGLWDSMKATIRRVVESHLSFREHDRNYPASRIAELTRELDELLG